MFGDLFPATSIGIKHSRGRHVVNRFQGGRNGEFQQIQHSTNIAAAELFVVFIKIHPCGAMDDRVGPAGQGRVFIVRQRKLFCSHIAGDAFDSLPLLGTHLQIEPCKILLQP